MTSRFTVNKQEPTTNPDKKVDIEVGAMWQKSSPAAGTYFKIKIIIDGKELWLKSFSNRHKKKDTSPDFVIYKD